MMIKTDLKRAIFSWRFLISIIGGIILFVHPIILMKSVWKMSTPLELFSMAMGLSDFTPFAVIFVVLPYGTSFCNDYRTAYFNSIVSRVGSKCYARGRNIAVALSGAMVMGIMMLAVIILCKLAAGMPESAESAAFLKGGPWDVKNLPLRSGGLWFYVLRILLAMLFGALWSSVSLLLSTIIPNPYIALVLPFVAYQILWYLLEKSMLNPLYYLRADYSGIPALWFAFVYQLFWIYLVCKGTQKLMERKLKQ